MLLLGGLAENKLLIFAKNSCLLCVLITLLELFQHVMDLNSKAINPEDFAPPLSTQERQKLLRLAAAFIELVETANVTYFMYGGTLLGSYRHHGMIPWDDDLDFIVDAADQSRLLQLLANHDTLLVTPYKRNKRGLWKLYFKHDCHYSRWLQSRPLLDIFFYKQNATHVWDTDSRFTGSSTFPKESVFPLVRRPYETFLLPSPCNPHDILMHHYLPEHCATRKHSHSYDIPIPSFMIKQAPCHLLYETFPFVQRTDWKNGTSMEVIRGKPPETAITVRNCVYR